MLKEVDKLEVTISENIKYEDEPVLSLLYLPLMKQDAYLLYKLLIVISKKESLLVNHQLLVKISGLSIGKIENARIVLEKFGLVKTYYSKSKATYMILLLAPMDARKFLKHEVYGRMFLNEMGEETYALVKNTFLPQSFVKGDYEDMSQSMTNLLRENWNEDYENVYNKIKKDINKKAIQKHINFNYDIFLKNYETVWPKNKRTKKQLEIIGEVATLYGISEKAMRRIVSRSLNPVNFVLDEEKLRVMASNSNAKFDARSSDIYKWPPRRFLESKQDGTPISSSDQEIIRMLLEEYRFSSEVINVLLEYVLKTSDNKLIKKYVESIAATWSRSKIDTFEKAKARVEKESKDASVAWKKTTTNNVVEKTNEAKKLSEQERTELINKLKGTSNGD